MRKRTSSIVTLLVALVCIAIYTAALLYGALRMYISITERQNMAEREFYDLTDLASSAGVLGFMNDKFQETLQDALGKSRTLQALIISGPGGEFAFERERGSTINWVGDSPRFIQKIGVSSKGLFAPLRIEGLRNIAMRATSQYLDYDYFIVILKQTLLAVLAALVLAFVTLLLESAVSKNRNFEAAPPKAPKVKPGRIKKAPERRPAEDQDAFSEDDVFGEEGENEPDFQTAPRSENRSAESPQGLYSPRSNIGWEAYTRDRLASELHRCASFEQDLTLILMEYRNPGAQEEQLYAELAEAAVRFFNLRDLIFERGERGLSVIFPNIDLEQGLAKAEEFHNRLPSSLSETTDLYIGLSSRAGRLVNAERLLFEAAQALRRAAQDPISPIVAFKSDPEKYRAFIASQKKRRS